ncbi:MAG: DUF4404 family protein [Planctomycetaceae bacterium]|nr:DUF4404 family protein [Planctomycetaceae bacterium]
MDTNELNDTLASLHEELTHGQELDEESRERLRVLLDDIRVALDGDPAERESPSSKDGSLGDRLQSAVVEFEAAHPHTSQLIGRIADGLSNMGI